MYVRLGARVKDDRVCGDADSCPLDILNDADSDGACADKDSCPQDSANDADSDFLCGDVDTCPADGDNDFDGDGVCGDVDETPYGEVTISCGVQSEGDDAQSITLTYDSQVEVKGFQLSAGGIELVTC